MKEALLTLGYPSQSRNFWTKACHDLDWLDDLPSISEKGSTKPPKPLWNCYSKHRKDLNSRSSNARLEKIRKKASDISQTKSTCQLTANTQPFCLTSTNSALSIGSLHSSSYPYFLHHSESEGSVMSLSCAKMPARRTSFKVIPSSEIKKENFNSNNKPSDNGAYSTSDLESSEEDFKLVLPKPKPIKAHFRRLSTAAIVKPKIHLKENFVNYNMKSGKGFSNNRAIYEESDKHTANEEDEGEDEEEDEEVEETNQSEKGKENKEESMVEVVVREEEEKVEEEIKEEEKIKEEEIEESKPYEKPRSVKSTNSTASNSKENRNAEKSESKLVKTENSVKKKSDEKMNQKKSKKKEIAIKSPKKMEEDSTSEEDEPDSSNEEAEAYLKSLVGGDTTKPVELKNYASTELIGNIIKMRGGWRFNISFTEAEKEEKKIEEEEEVQEEEAPPPKRKTSPVFCMGGKFRDTFEAFVDRWKEDLQDKEIMGITEGAEVQPAASSHVKLMGDCENRKRAARFSTFESSPKKIGECEINLFFSPRQCQL